MKNIKYFLFLMLGVLVMSSCSDDKDTAVFNSANTVAPTLQAINSSYVLEMANADKSFATFTYSAASWGDVALGTKYQVEASLTQDFASPVQFDASTGNSISSVTVAKINNIILNAGINPGTATKMFFRVKAYATGESANVSSISALTSAVVSTTVTPYSTKIEYPKVWVLGDYNGWSHDKAQFLFSYNSNTVYTGVIDFSEKYAALQWGFKITGAASWDNATGNWGATDGTQVADAAMTLANNGANITAYQGTKRFYRFTFTKVSMDAPTLAKDIAFNTISIVGEAGSQVSGWGTKEVVLNFDTTTQLFYADVTFGSGEFKFRLDKDWATNWGGAEGVLKAGGDNIKVTAGNYRVYVDLNNPDKMTYELNTKDYGK